MKRWLDESLTFFMIIGLCLIAACLVGLQFGIEQGRALEREELEKYEAEIHAMYEGKYRGFRDAMNRERAIGR